MIVKKVSNPKKSASKSVRVTGLVNYISGPERENGLEKCIHREAMNFLTNAHRAQIAEMTALSEESIRSKDPVDHWVISWRPEERPTVEQAREAVDIFVNQCGLEGHQFVWGLHDDTQNMHVHIAINRVHPDTEKVVKINKGFDKEAGQQAGALIEHAHGWKPAEGSRYEVINGKPTRREHRVDKLLEPSTKARDMEMRTGEKSAQRIGIEDVAPIISTARSWRELHDKLHTIGMSYEQSGSGAIIRIGDVTVKASSVDRKASLSALQKRLGVFASGATECVTPDLSNLSTQQMNKGIEHVLRTKNSHKDNLNYLAYPEHDPNGSPAQRRGGLYELSYVSLDDDRQISERLLQDTIHDSMGNPQSWQDSDLRRTISSGRSGGIVEHHVTKPLKENQPGWNDYQTIKAEIQAKGEAIKEKRTKLKEQHKLNFANFKAAHKLERDALLPKLRNNPDRLQREKILLLKKQLNARAQVLDMHKSDLKRLKFPKLLDYASWLEVQKTKAGVEEESDFTITAIGFEKLNEDYFDIRDFTPEVSIFTGNVRFNNKRGEHAFTVTDKNIKVKLDRDPVAVLAALQMATARYGKLTLTGDAAFQKLCVDLAVTHGFNFADAKLNEAVKAQREPNKTFTAKVSQKEPASVQPNPTQAQSAADAAVAPEALVPISDEEMVLNHNAVESPTNTAIGRVVEVNGKNVVINAGRKNIYIKDVEGSERLIEGDLVDIHKGKIFEKTMKEKGSHER